MVRAPRFEPGSSAWQADVLDQTRLRPHGARLRPKIINTLIKIRASGLREATARLGNYRLLKTMEGNLAVPSEPERKKGRAQCWPR